jgi:coenzyme F420-0:L-glutamate ligase/coenzyme F420-1:gamma-L-glutamate ligase
MPKGSAVSIIPVPLRGEVQRSDEIVDKFCDALRHHKLSLKGGDILVIKHKIVSKSEGRMVRLRDVKPSREAMNWARASRSDPALAEIVLTESQRIVRKKVIAGRGLLITETPHGFICANSGVDLSNVDGGDHAVLLPKDPDASAARIRSSIRRTLGVDVAVIITDSFGRPWREGLTEVAIGVAGMKPIADLRGKRDPHGYMLHASAEALADELACAAGLVCGKLNRTPFCIVRGFKYQRSRGSARELIRARKNDLFR